MNITSEVHLSATVITITGEFMADDADQFHRNMRDFSEDFDSNIIIDCSELTLIDSVGLESLLWLSDELNRNGNKLKFAAVSPSVHRVFEITRLERVFSTDDTVEAAARSFV
ncbi:MAG: STAS domain-containing protein [Phycisphaerae bacterium]|jgi:anti-sigma B factor antagonist|nr:STAS domain-containing protein [Phycisphaerae bacterium]